MKKGIRTKFSPSGLFAVLMTAVPVLIMRANAFDFSHDILSFICAATDLFLVLSISLLQNTEAPVIDRRGRIFSIASISYGLFFLFLVLFVIGKGGLIIVILAHIFMYIFFIMLSVDRHNWISLSAASSALILTMIRESIITGRIL